MDQESALSIPIMVGIFLVAIVVIAGNWKMFEKAGKPGWACLVPIYNVVVMLQIIGRPLWWILLFFVPIVSLIIAVVMSIDMAKSFGKGVGFGLGIAFLGFIFIPILGFGDAQYQGASAS